MQEKENAYKMTQRYAKEMDHSDALASCRQQFLLPKHGKKDAIYLCGNSLGLQPKEAKTLIEQELNDWAKYGVEGHFEAKNPWFAYHTFFTESLAKLVGATNKEVVAMNTLTVNLHLLMLSFYRPSKQRYKIIMEAGAFLLICMRWKRRRNCMGLIQQTRLLKLHLVLANIAFA